ncbi:MAG: D-glycero-beta-D-manno-heptose 1,7-bisphosphate 7-phosphatase [Gammaproteobacteria bacterium]
MTKLIILDRDGVINHDSPNYIRSPEEWNPIPGSLEAIAQLNQAGYLVVVATNQSAINRRMFSLDVLKAIHDKMTSMLESHGGYFDGIYYCPHRPDDNCTCRKPQPGMIQKILSDFGIQPEEAIGVGDSYRDLEALQSAGCRAALVMTGNGKLVLQKHDVSDIPKFDNLSAFVEDFLK